jgi:hypothetical protein
LTPDKIFSGKPVEAFLRKRIKSPKKVYIQKKTSVSGDAKMESKGIGTTVKIVVIVVVVVAVMYFVVFPLLAALYVAEIYVPPPSLMVTAEASGTVFDKDDGPAENYVNAKTSVTVVIETDDIDDVLDPTDPLKITISGDGKTWTTGVINLLTTSGKTEANYGERIEIDGVVDTTEDSNLYVKISVPTTAGGEVDEEMAITITLWPTLDATNAIDGTITPATFDNACVDDYWNEGEIIDIKISAREDALTLTGFDGAYLLGRRVG